MDNSHKIIGPHSHEYIAAHGDAHLKCCDHAEEEKKRVVRGEGPRGQKGEKGDPGPPGEAVVKTLRLWVAIIALTVSLLTGLGMATSQIIDLKHRLDAASQTAPSSLPR
jgi:hypothetical protein